ncbi:MAG: xanthine dehydrogenase accessory protein XdhC [Hyphomicrobiales bacterium]|nr:xanthine dehydrogenase accessory protein XdhC [Hyphomicrobiales bacterium]
MTDAQQNRDAHVRVTIVAVMGSAPREVGAAMIVSESGTSGTIGGGALEHAAIAFARDILAKATAEDLWPRECVEFPLGPALGQCCGGWVELLFEVLADGFGMGYPKHGAMVVRRLQAGAAPRFFSDRLEVRGLPHEVYRVVQRMLSGHEPHRLKMVEADGERWIVEPVAEPRTPLFIYGAGHVGRQLVRVLADLPFDITWVDVSAERFPMETAPIADCASSCLRVATDRPQDVAALAPGGAFHLVLTYSHALDEEITRVLLRAGAFGYLGLIGSRTKRARFIQRFRAAGITDTAIARLVCPIGAGITRRKEPAMIAVAVAAELLAALDRATADHSASADRRTARPAD